MANLGFRDNGLDAADIVDSFFDNSELFPPTPTATGFSPFAQQQHSNHHHFHQHLPSLPGLIGAQSDPFASFAPSYRSLLDSALLPTPPGAPLSPNRRRDPFTSIFPDFAFPALQPGLPDFRLPWEQPSHGYRHCPFAPLRNQQASTPQPSHDIHSTASATSLPEPTLPQTNQRATNSRAAGRDPSDDYFLAALATGHFSSPSLPPISSSPRLPTRPQPSNLPKPLEVGEDMSLSTSRRRRSSRGGVVDLTKEEPDFDAPNYGIDPSTPALTMPTTRRRNTAGATRSSGEPSRKRRPSASTSSRPGKTRRKETSRNDLASPFDDDEQPALLEHDVPDSIDLSNVTEVPRVDNRVKLSKFQCVICMDDVTALTVTHCGHLFCSECLHSALHIDSMKKTCPVCRTKVDLKDKKGKNTKSYYHLELKVLTATKKGKRPAGQ
ncbi:hypothetical protein F5X99DRAFT_245348 [Biscogniauxia marginata]|nr:hypothetical protein F5X99DRAFT_245348 [Biscogniauxia marginata]